MDASSRYRSDNADPGERRRKQRALFLAVVLHVLVFVILLQQKVFVPMKKDAALTTINIAVPAAEKAKAAPRKKAEQAAKKAKAPPPRPIPTPISKPDPELPFIDLSKADFAATDISKMASSNKGSGKQASAGAAVGPGEGPGGGQLHNADWYRQPTSGEVTGYLPANAPRSGWGMVACRTIDRFQVESCRVIGEFPLGSGFGRAVRQAAWQFRVIPPRIDGKPMIGTWVRIRISYNEGGIEAE